MLYTHLQRLLQLLLLLGFLVNSPVPVALVAARESPRTDVALERLLAGVRSDVRRQMVAATECSFADVALERFLTRVNAHVPLKFVATRETPTAVGRRTDERLAVRDARVGVGTGGLLSVDVCFGSGHRRRGY